MPLVKATGVAQEAATETKATGYIAPTRDFGSEARGKTRCALITPLMPSLIDITKSPDAIKEDINMWVEYVFTGK